MKGYIYRIGNTICLLVKTPTGRWYTTGRTIQEAFQRLDVIIKTS